VQPIFSLATEAAGRPCPTSMKGRVENDSADRLSGEPNSSSDVLRPHARNYYSRHATGDLGQN